MMRQLCATALSLATVFFLGGCEHGHDHPHDAGKPVAAPSPDSHAALHVTKYNEVLVEFPGHKYAMEIIDEKETTGLVTAYLTDAHFEPCEVDAQEVRLNFVIAGQPKVFTLTRSPQETGKPATYTLTDMQLATLNCEGWAGEATAAVEIGGVPYIAPLIKLSRHGEHSHAH